MRLEGKVALITGAGAGIGRATAERFAREGARVVVVDRDEHTGKETVERIMQAGGVAIFVHADVSQPDAVRAMFRVAVERFGRLDIVFNNAGTVAQGRVEDTSEEEWEYQVATTLTSVFLGCKYAVPILREQGGGVIINMASVAGIMGVVNRAAYSAAKGGVVALTRAVALDHAREGIRVNCISPATIETPSLLERIQSAPDPVAARRAFEARQPIGRIGQPEDVAAAALYLASDEAAFVTGTNLIVDGGMSV
ncbi:MAG: glucose 1-dehydrogenase [Chloroherpetonaceae bacterium]|nr:glucose 1-dehydrogenase [Chthonomonadaceae bacterium]MDW8207559.1 glucose 1-dehydrogenase [Chloroherpetonaceae bacterium]